MNTPTRRLVPSGLFIWILLAGTVQAKDLRNVVWVFSNEVSSAADRNTLVSRSAASGVTDLYVSVFQSVPNSEGRRMREDADIAALIRAAKKEKIKVWAAYGSPDWPTFECTESAFPVARMLEVVAYNKAHRRRNQLFGVALDVEPPDPQTEQDYQNLLDLYLCLRDALPNRVRLSVAVRFFWDDVIEYPSGSGDIRPVHEHLVDMPLDAIVVMGYRDRAGTSCPSNTIICLDEVEVAAATAARSNRLILVGVETNDCAPGCGPEKVTFFEEGQRVLNREAAKVLEHFSDSRGFGGFAIHRYDGMYLSGTAKWPTTNPDFPD